MATYTNNKKLLAFTIDGIDYIGQKGEALELPDEHPHVKALIAKGHISKQIKMKKK